MEGLACRVVTPHLLSSGRGHAARGTVNGADYDLSLSDYIETKAWITGRQDPEVLSFCQMNLPPGGTAIDVGANVGFVTVPLAKYAQSVGGRVIAIEALPRNVERLARHVTRAGVEQSVDIIACAAGDAPGEADITVAQGSGFISNGVVSKLDEDLFVPSSPLPPIAVNTLDAICDARGIEAIDVIKLDVEGFEPLVLHGASGLLARGAIRVGVIEVNEELLALRGWRRETLLQLLRDSGLQPEPLKRGGNLHTASDIAFRACRDFIATEAPTPGYVAG